MGKQVSKLGGPGGRRHQEIPEEAFTFSALYKEPPPLDLRLVRRLILGRKLAPIWRGVSELQDSASRWEFEECPICLLLYKGGLNRSVCCRQAICSECFLQMATESGSLVQSSKPCPFCNSSSFRVIFVGPLTPSEIARFKEDEERTRQVEERMRVEESRRDIERLEKRKAESEQRSAGTGSVVRDMGGGAASAPTGTGIQAVQVRPEPGEGHEEEILAGGDSGELQTVDTGVVPVRREQPSVAGALQRRSAESQDPAVIAARVQAAVVQLARRLERHSSPTDEDLVALDDDQLALALALSMRDAHVS